MKTTKYISAILLLLLSISCSSDFDNKYEFPEIPNQFTNFTIDNDTQSIDNEITVTIQSGDYESISVRFVDEIGVPYTPPKTEPSEGENASDLDNVIIPTITATENNNLEYKISATKLRLGEKALSEVESFLLEVKVLNNSGVELTGYDRIYFSDVEYIFNSNILFNETGDNSQIFNVGIEDTDDLNTNIIAVGGTGIVSENKNFIGVSTADASDDGATATFTFALTTNSATAINATLNLELAKRAKGSVSGTVSVTGYPDTPFSYAATSTVDGGSAPVIDFEFASTISLTSGAPLTVTITLDEMLTEGNTTAPIFRLSKVTVARDESNPINPNNISFNETGDNSQIFNVGVEDTDDLNTNIIAVGGTGIVSENKNFIGVATADANDDGATATFTFDLTTDSATAINATLNLELAKRAKGSVSGTVSVTGYPDTPFSYEATSTVDGGSAPAIDFEFASTISLVSGTPLTVTITLDEMLTEGNTTTPIFRLSKVIINKDGNTPEPTQDTWLDVDNSISNLTLSTTCTDCSVTTVANPDAADAEATNVTKWTIPSTSGSGNKSLVFNFNDGAGVKLADYANLIVTVRMYWPSFNDISNFDSNERIRFYLSDGVNAQQIQGNFVESNEAGWHTIEFDFTGTPSGAALTSDIISGEIRLVGNKFTNIDNGLKFYIDTITTNL